MPTSALATSFEDDVLTISVQGSVVASVWSQTPTVRHITEVGRALAHHAERSGTRVVWVTVLRGSAMTTPDPAVQEAFRSVTEALTSRIRAHALVIIVPGVMGMLLRTLFRGASVRFFRAFAFKVFDEIDAGAAWTAGHTGSMAAEAPEALARWLGQLSGVRTHSREPSVDDITERCDVD